MGILIGMDEAGYGPNFGPLVVAATAWHCADSGEVPVTTARKNRRKSSATASASTGSATATVAPIKATVDSRDPAPEKNGRWVPAIADTIDLYRLLRPTISKSASERRIAIADSKALYTPGLGLRQLERGLHSVLRSMQQVLTCWSDLIDYCAADPDGHYKTHCWPDGHNSALPIDAAADELARLEPRLTRACESAQVRPLFIRARLVFPAEFNELVNHYGTKGAALSHVTVGLLREVIDKVTIDHTRQPPVVGKFLRNSHLASRRDGATIVPSPQPPIFVLCDKHGGRNFYTALLQHHFSEHWIEPVYESHAESHYAWGPPESRTQVSFRMRGERFLPTALASMAAKYLRELSMRGFNDFWSTHVPDLRPTAGYPKDSHRFRKDIAAAQSKLRIDDHVLWRSR
jgi:hypothetical protein